MRPELYIARRYLLNRRQGAWGLVVSIMSVGSVALGVAALIITLAVMTGFREDIQTKILGFQPHVKISGIDGELNPNDAAFERVLNNNPEIEAWAPYVMGQILIGRGAQSTGAIIKGLIPSQELTVTKIESKLRHASWSVLDAPESGGDKKPAIILGQELARSIGARIGDNVWAITPGSIGITAFSIPKAHLFRVEGFLETGLYEYDAGVALINLQESQKLFGLNGRVSEIGVRLKNIDRADEMARVIQAELEGRYWVRSWLALNRNLFSALKLEKTVMFIILTLVTLVSSFMIVSNLLLLITQKVKEIGILRAMGADAAFIRRTFLLKGFLMGAIGTCGGVILGVGISLVLAHTNFIHLPADVYYIDRLPVRIEFLDVLTVVAAALSIVLVATLYPARKAAQLDPIEAIRYG